MSTNLETALTAMLGKAAREAGLTVLSADAGTDFNNRPTAQFKLALSPDAPPAKTLQLELSDAFDFRKPDHSYRFGLTHLAPPRICMVCTV